MPKASGILFCGGGTGGHVLPGLAVAARLRARGEAGIRWIGDPQRIEARLVPGAGIPLLPFGLSRPRISDPRWLFGAARLAWRCLAELRAHPPRAVVALGGYAALLPGLLAPLCRRPLVVMEQNARAGRTNKLLARFARAVVTQFPEAIDGLPAAKVRLLGNPVRAIAHRPRGGAAELRVLVVGGSLAAKSLNDLIVGAAAALARIPGLTLVHLAGDDDRARVEAIYAQAGVRAEVHGYHNDMPALYDRVDLAVTRAGATTVAELCAAGIGALYVPLPWSADDHQTANARSVSTAGGALLLPQQQTAPADIAAHLARLAADRGAVAAMGAAARALARPHAADRVADLVQSAAHRRRWRVIARTRARRAHAASVMARTVESGPTSDVRRPGSESGSTPPFTAASTSDVGRRTSDLPL